MLKNTCNLCKYKVQGPQEIFSSPFLYKFVVFFHLLQKTFYQLDEGEHYQHIFIRVIPLVLLYLTLKHVLVIELWFRMLPKAC